MKLLAKLFLAFALCFSAVQVFGIEEAFESGPMDKLGRGIANVAFSPLELLIRPYDVTKEQGEIAGLTTGVIEGVVFTVCRIGVGVVDIVTFLVPFPGGKDDPNETGFGYGPIMRPAWVVDTDHNAFNFFFDDDSIATGN